MIEALATVRCWGLELADQTGFEAAIRKRFRAGALVRMRVEPARATRSIQANRYYWGVVVDAIAEHTGYDPDDVHEILKARFLPKPLAVRAGNGRVVAEYVIGGTTTTLTDAEFSDYCRRIKAWALDELDVAIPDPEPLHAVARNSTADADNRADACTPIARGRARLKGR